MRNSDFSVEDYMEQFKMLTVDQLYALQPYDIPLKPDKYESEEDRYKKFCDILRTKLKAADNYRYSDVYKCIFHCTAFDKDYDYEYIKAVDVFLNLINTYNLDCVIKVFKADKSSYPSLLTFFRVKNDSEEDGGKTNCAQIYDIIHYEPGEESMYNRLIQNFDSRMIVSLDYTRLDQYKELDYENDIIYTAVIKDNPEEVGDLVMGNSIEELKEQIRNAEQQEE